MVVMGHTFNSRVQSRFTLITVLVGVGLEKPAALPYDPQARHHRSPFGSRLPPKARQLSGDELDTLFEGFDELAEAQA
jgi:hypothetical protein